jgi:signal transduction histidine kinase
VRTLNDNDNIIVEVTDTGIGINAEDIANIFNRFYRAESARAAHDSGTGLGLAIVKKIVEMHNGSIEVTSTIGKGSTFRIRLPLAKIPA